MISKTVLTCIFIIFMSGQVLLNAQATVQTIRGSIIDKITSAPLTGASVILPGTSPLKGTVTDTTGSFIFENISPGRYSLKVTRIGYHGILIPGLLLNAGKEQVLEIALTEKINLLDEITVKAGENTGPVPVNVSYLSSRLITEEETRRYAATFYDPIRVAATTPGTSTTNDQANHLVVRGNSPVGLLWRIEGADVVNPNHLTNAGTYSDKPSLTGGGITILSAQLTENTIFMNSAFPAGYGNVLGGIFDVSLRKGNNREYEFTGQAGLLGIDLAAEGPFSKNYNGSFLVNFRYSTLGLFSLAGIPIGDEKINFYDLSFKIVLPAGNRSTFTLFGAGGKSITLYSGQLDSLMWQFRKDRTDVDFFSDMGVSGLTHEILIDEKSGFRTNAAISVLTSGRKENYISDDYSLIPIETDMLLSRKVSVSSYYYRKLSKKHTFKSGIILNNDRIELESERFSDVNPSPEEIHNGAAEYMVVQPFVQYEYRISSGFTLNPGLHFNYSGLNGELSPEPRISFKADIDSSSYITAGYGLHSQMQHPSVYFNSVTANLDLGLTKAHHLVVGYSKWLADNLFFRSEAYYQYLFKVPVSGNRRSSFSAINLMETADIDDLLINQGTGRNFGVEMSLERLFSEGYYFLFGGSLFKSLYTGSDMVERDSRFSGLYQFKMTAGRESGKKGKSGNSTIGINVGTVLSGGMRYTPVDVLRSEILKRTIYHEENPFSEKFRDFFRVDLRLIWRKNKPSFTGTLSLDIQNVTNRKNPAWIYYDAQQKKVVTKNQLGIIPFVSYSVEF